MALTDGERDILREQEMDCQETMVSGPCSECGEDASGLEGEPETFICQFCAPVVAGL